MNITEIATATPIIVMCYVVGMICKAIDGLADKWIPIIVAIVGMLISIPAFFFMPNFPAEDIFTALAVGIMSGLASVGANQIYKQISKNNE